MHKLGVVCLPHRRRHIATRIHCICCRTLPRNQCYQSCFGPRQRNVERDQQHGAAIREAQRCVMRRRHHPSWRQEPRRIAPAERDDCSTRPEHRLPTQTSDRRKRPDADRVNSRRDPRHHQNPEALHSRNAVLERVGRRHRILRGRR